MNASWSVREAKRALAQAKANAEAGPCPNCGASADVDLIDVGTSWGDFGFLPGAADCSARCYDTDPEGYLRAVTGERA